MLALTSSADLEQTTDIVAIRDCVLRYAPLFYTHADRVRRIGHEESLYIITGCIKSDSWALAAYRQPMAQPYDLLRLVHAPDVGDNPSCEMLYEWTHCGTSDTRSSDRSENGSKNQSLFLTGFSLSVSSAFRSRMKQSPRPGIMPPDPEDKWTGQGDSSNSGDGHFNGGSGRHEGQAGGDKGRGSFHCQSFGGATSRSLQLNMFPMNRSEVSLVPCAIRKWSIADAIGLGAGVSPS